MPVAPRPVCHLVTTLNLGGTERQLVELLRHLDCRRWSPRLACFRKSGAFLDEVRALGLDPIELSLRGSFKRPNTAWVVARLCAWLAREKAALLHCHDVDAALVGVPAAKLVRVPVIAARRDLAHDVGLLKRRVLRLALTRADMVLANAHAVAAQAERLFGVPPGRIAIVPNGLDLDRFDALAAAPPAVPLPPAELLVVKVARMRHEDKGHDDLLHAAALARARAPGLRYLLVGDGRREPELRARAARLGVADLVTFAGKRLDVPAILARAGIVCHASRAEGLPNAILEAMAARRPIVAACVGGVADLIDDGVTGLLVPPGRPDALADRLVRLAADPGQRAALGAAARARVERDLSAQELARRIDALYARVARPIGPLPG